jgi:hypothetical protein
METESVYKSPPFTLKVVKDDIEGYVFNGDIHLFEVDRNKLRENLLAYIKALQAILEVLQNGH